MSKKLDESNNKVQGLLVQLVDAKVIEENLQIQLSNRMYACHNVEEVIVGLRNEIEIFSIQASASYKFNKKLEQLNEIRNA